MNRRPTLLTVFALLLASATPLLPARAAAAGRRPDPSRGSSHVSLAARSAPPAGGSIEGSRHASESAPGPASWQTTPPQRSAVVRREDGSRPRRPDPDERGVRGPAQRGRSRDCGVLATVAPRPRAAPEAVFHEANAPPRRLSHLPGSFA
jgi:hypothetical protein